MKLLFHVLVYCVLVAGAVRGQAVSLFNDGVVFVSARSSSDPGSPALFMGRAEGGMFSERVRAEPAVLGRMPSVRQGTDVMAIRAIIEEAESRRDGYNAVQFGARIKPPKRPTEMTLEEIYQWIADTPGQPHAIGRYQFIPSTLKRVVRKVGISLKEQFDADVQDQLADVLLAEAGLKRFRKGELGRKAFMNNLAKIWAGLPNSSGKSHYHGVAGNKASVTWARFDAVIAQIEPKEG